MVKYYLQKTIASLTKWSNNTGFNFFSEKSQYNLFTKKINHEIPQINIDNRQISTKKNQNPRYDIWLKTQLVTPPKIHQNVSNTKTQYIKNHFKHILGWRHPITTKDLQSGN